MKLSDAGSYLKLIQAAAEGKTIQHFDQCRQAWTDKEFLKFGDAPESYRVKPDN